MAARRRGTYGTDARDLRYFRGRSGNDYLVARDGKGRFRTWRVDLIKVPAHDAALDCGAEEPSDTNQAWKRLFGNK